MIRKEYEELLILLRAFYEEAKPVFEEEPHWDQLLKLSYIHSVTGIACYMISQYALTSSDAVRQAAKEETRKTLYLYVQRGEATKRLLKELDDHGIDHGMMKGYILRNCYPVPELRSYGDMDLVIRREDRQKTHDLMIRMGYEPLVTWEPVYSYHKGTELYEFHTDIIGTDVSEKADLKTYFQSVWEHMIPEQGHTYVMENEYHFLYLLAHIAKHISESGAGLRMYLDIAFFIKAYGDFMDWDWIRGELKNLNLSFFANTVLTAVQQWFGADSPIPLQPVSDAVMEDFLLFTMEGGTFGAAGRDAGLIALKRNERDGDRVSRTAVLLHRLFPSASTIEKRYTYLQGRHWLLPAAWLHRLIITRKTWGKHVTEAKDILSADEQEVLRLKRIYSDIGL